MTSPSVGEVFTVLAVLLVLWCLVASAAFVGALLAQEPVRRRVKTQMPGGAKTGIILETDEEIWEREEKDRVLVAQREGES